MPASSSEPQARSNAQINATTAWNEFESAFRLHYAYLDRDDLDSNALLARTQNLAVQARTSAEFRRVVRRMTYAFTDPHLVVGPLDDKDFNVIPTSADLRIAKVAGSYVVNDVRAHSAADEAEIRPGWQLVSVDGQPIDEAAAGVFRGLVPDPTTKQLSYAATLLANGQRAGDRQLTFEEPEGRKVELRLPSPREFALALLEQPILRVSRDGSIGVIRINNSLGNNDLIFAFDEALRTLGDTQGLVLDLRNTPSGGNTEVARSIIGHFIDEIRAYQVHEIPSLEREFTVPRRFVEQVVPREPYYDPRRVVVLGSYWTGSMGEGLVIGLDAAAGTYSIASDMGDLLGALTNLELEASEMRLDLGNEAMFHVDGTPREQFVANRALNSSERDERGGDPSLQLAIQHLQQSAR